MDIPSIWFKVYTVYQKDPRLLGEWLSLIESDFGKALEIAGRLTGYDVKPDTLLLGFSPQILLAVIVAYGPGVKVITSPQVWSSGETGPGKHSHRLLKLLYREGFIEDIIEVDMAPTNNLPPSKVVNKVIEAVKKVKPGIIDISGGTQLAAIATTLTTNKISYTYPLGRKVHIYKLW